MATTVIYNGVILHNVTTEKWTEEVVYDESRTDRIGTKYAFRFRGIFHAQRVPLDNSEVFISGGAAPDIFDLLAIIKKKLLEPRATLDINIGGPTALTIEPSDLKEPTSVSDVNNGPKPVSADVQPIGASAFRITFEINAETSDCNKKRTGDSLVLSNRWALSETMDANYAISRLIRGTMRVANGMRNPTEGIRAFSFKHLTIPPLEDSFKRDRVAFTVEPDGLTVHYEVLDKQVHTAAPWPATRISGAHTEAVQHGNYFVSEMSVRLEGDPAVDKRILLERAVQVLDARLQLDRVKNAEMENFVVIDEIGEQAAVSASARVKRVEVPATLAFGTLLQKVGAPLELPPLANHRGHPDAVSYDNQHSRVPALHGYRASSNANDWERNPLVTMFLHVYLQNPCTDQHQMNQSATAVSPERRSSQRVDATSVTEIPYSQPIVDEFNSFSEDTGRAMYTIAEIVSRYHSNTMRTQMPVADGDKGTASQVLQLSRPQSYRYYEVNVERVGAEPAIPEPLDTYEDRGVTAYLKAFDVEMLPPVRSPDGRQRIERRIAKYLYLLDQEPDFTKPLPVGVNPVTNFPGFNGKAKLNFGGDMGVGGQSGNFTKS